MRDLILVATGGAIGATARHLASKAAILPLGVLGILLGLTIVRRIG